MSRLTELARGAATGTVIRTVSVASPAANTGFTVSPDAGRAWEVLSVTCTLVTAADAGTRNPALVYTAGGPTLWSIPAVQDVIASKTTVASWVANLGTGAAHAALVDNATPMPPAILLAGYTIGVSILGGQTTDQLSAITLQVLEASTGEREYARTIAGHIAGHAEAIADLLTGDL